MPAQIDFGRSRHPHPSFLYALRRSRRQILRGIGVPIHRNPAHRYTSVPHLRHGDGTAPGGLDGGGESTLVTDPSGPTMMPTRPIVPSFVRYASVWYDIQMTDAVVATTLNELTTLKVWPCGHVPFGSGPVWNTAEYRNDPWSPPHGSSQS